MRAWIGPLAVAAVLALGGILAVATINAPPAGSTAQALAAELRCPDCQALSVAESRTAAANAIRSEIAAQLAAGRSADEVRQHFVDRYGEWILLRPAAPLAWLLPVVATVAAVALLGLWLWRRRSAPVPAPLPVDEATRQRLAREAESLDG